MKQFNKMIIAAAFVAMFGSSASAVKLGQLAKDLKKTTKEIAQILNITNKNGGYTGLQNKVLSDDQEATVRNHFAPVEQENTKKRKNDETTQVVEDAQVNVVKKKKNNEQTDLEFINYSESQVKGFESDSSDSDNEELYGVNLDEYDSADDVDFVGFNDVSENIHFTRSLEQDMIDSYAQQFELGQNGQNLEQYVNGYDSENDGDFDGFNDVTLKAHFTRSLEQDIIDSYSDIDNAMKKASYLKKQWNDLVSAVKLNDKKAVTKALVALLTAAGLIAQSSNGLSQYPGTIITLGGLSGLAAWLATDVAATILGQLPNGSQVLATLRNLFPAITVDNVLGDVELN